MRLYIAENAPNANQLESIPVWFWFVPVVVIPGVWFLATRFSGGKRKRDD